MFKLNPNLREFWRTPKPYKILKGGRFSSKTQDAGGMAAFLARNYSLRIMCVRQFQNRIADSVYTVVKNKIEAAGWSDEFVIGVSSIRHKKTGSEFLFYGLARNISEIKGTEDVDILWIEEGEGLTAWQWTILDPTLRGDHSEIWILYNPQHTSDFVESELPELLGDDAIIRHINYPDNPFLSERARQKAERLLKVDPDGYRHIYLGEPKTDDELSLIKASWVEAAINAHDRLGLDLGGPPGSALDVADTGADCNAQAFTEGLILLGLETWDGSASEDIFRTTERAIANCAARGTRSFRYDADGLGAGVRGDARVVNEKRAAQGLPKVEASAFHGGGGVANPDAWFIAPEGDMPGITNGKYFANFKAQSWWRLAERFRKTHEAVVHGTQYEAAELISLSMDCDHLPQLKKELAQVRKRLGSPKFTVDKNPDGAASPNLADCVMMAYAEAPRLPANISHGVRVEGL